MPKTTKWRDIRHTNDERNVEKHREELLAEIGLYQLRQERELSQAALAERLGVSQPAISQIEKAGDVRLSTLVDYVEALGGKLHLEATFDDKTYPLAIEFTTFKQEGLNMMPEVSAATRMKEDRFRR